MALDPIESNLNELDELAVIYHDHLVLSTGLIMRIDCCEEIWISLRLAIHIIWSSGKWWGLSFRVRKSHLGRLKYNNIEYCEEYMKWFIFVLRFLMKVKSDHRSKVSSLDI